MREKFVKMQNKQKQYYDKSTKKLKELKEGDKVYLYKERNGKQWNTGVIRVIKHKIKDRYLYINNFN